MSSVLRNYSENKQLLQLQLHLQLQLAMTSTSSGNVCTNFKNFLTLYFTIVGDIPLPYEVASCLPGWEASCSTAMMLKGQVVKFGLNVCVDDITPDKGDCFFVAVIQQLRRPEIFSTLPRSLQQMADLWNHLALRKAVCSFAKSSPEVAARREFFLYSTGGVPWDVYWGANHLMRATVWVDAAAVQVTAWFLQMDLMIVSDSSNSQNPITRIHGSFDEIPNGSTKELLLGAKTGSHYQSLLPNSTSSPPTSQRGDHGKTINSMEASTAIWSGYKTMSSSPHVPTPNPDSMETFPTLAPRKIQSKPPLGSARPATRQQDSTSTSLGYKTTTWGRSKRCSS